MRFAVKFAAMWLAAWFQVVVVATMPLGQLVAPVDPLGNVPICHAGGDDGQAPPQPGQLDHCCVLCVICQAHTASIALLSAAPALPTERAVATVSLDAPRARAPPSRIILAAQPRGPPFLT